MTQETTAPAQFCSQCGTGLAAGARFCPTCGAAVPLGAAAAPGAPRGFAVPVSAPLTYPTGPTDPFAPPASYPPGYPPGYAPSGYGYLPQPATPATNGMAIASMVLGIVWVYWIGSILALIFGYIALNQIKRTGQNGRAMAIAGIVLGWIGVGLLLAVIALGVVGANSSQY
jgi:Domain of unknown function (DUF4190)/zinc-ribbon domain